MLGTLSEVRLYRAIGAAQAKSFSDQPKQYKATLDQDVLWMWRNDYLGDSAAEEAVRSANELTAQDEKQYDFATIWQSNRTSLINCKEDKSVGIMLISGSIQLETSRSGTTTTPEPGHLLVGPSNHNRHGKVLSITPTGTAKWLELRRTKDMGGKVCKKGVDCEQEICGFSHAETAGHGLKTD